MIADIDMHRIASAATRAARIAYSTFLEPDERQIVAVSAIGMAVVEAEEPLDWPGMVTVGTAAIEKETLAWRRDRGLNSNARAVETWWRDWNDPWHTSRRLRDPSTWVPNSQALEQVLAALPAAYRETLMLLAVTGSITAASAAADCTYTAMQHRIVAARTAAYDLWFDWEPAPPLTRDHRSSTPLPDTCGRGHEFTPENTRWRRATSGRGQKRACKACDRLAEERRRERKEAA